MNIPAVLLYPMIAHVGWVAFLYTLLTLVRAPAVWGFAKHSRVGQRWAEIEPRVSVNLSNQFEWPLFFYIACLLVIVNQGRLDEMQVYLAWVFIAGRVIHSGVQILTKNIRLRGIVFTINFLAVLGMWLRLAFSVSGVTS